MARPDVDAFGKGIAEINSKQEALAPYRYSIAMENDTSDHYFSEKLIDCLLMETVPIYFGGSGITESFDSRGMLCFSNLDELETIVASASAEQYESMRPYVLANKQKCIENQWHSHLGMFQRLTDKLPSGMFNASPVSPPKNNWWSRFAGKWKRGL